MKSTVLLTSLLLLAAAIPTAARSVAIAEHAVVNRAHNSSSPVTKIVTLITELKTHIQDDAAKEQKSYDTYACWCENTVERKAASMAEARKTIDDLSASIVKVEAEVASHEASIVNLKKDIKSNFDSQTDANDLREKELTAFEASKTEFESSIKALDAAIKVLDGAGTKTKGSFLGTLQEAQVLGVMAGVRTVLKSSTATGKLTSQDMEVMDQFVEKPEDYVGTRLSGFMSAAQIENNPFGDYAPQSTRIQGILSQLKETFEADLATAIKEESDKVKEFADLMSTKKMEAATLQKTLEIQEAAASSKAVQLATDKTTRDDTQAELTATEAFFAETKSSCKDKAMDWAERTRLRTEELSGIEQAIAVLTSPEAIKTFSESAKSLFFLQVSSNSEGNRREKVYKKLKKLATQFQNLAMAQIAAEVTTGGHFDKVIAMIDQMMQTLREEEAEDITHRDICQMKENANKNEISDLDHDITKVGEDITRTQSSIDQLGADITALEGDIEKSKKDLSDLLKARNEDETEFQTALKHDTDAVALLETAIGFLTQFYVKNKLSLGLLQNAEEPEYFKNLDKAPETSWSGAYKGRSSEGGGIVSILTLIKEDVQKEILKLQEAEASSQAEYLKMRSTLEGTLASQEALKVAKEKAKTALEGKKQSSEELKDDKNADKVNENNKKAALEVDCKWVTETFTSRRDKRKLEMDGLVEAKAFLAGVESGDAVLSP